MLSADLWQIILPHFVCLIEDSFFKNSILPYVFPLSISGLSFTVTDTWRTLAHGFSVCMVCTIAVESGETNHPGGRNSWWSTSWWTGTKEHRPVLAAGVCLPNTNLLGVFQLSKVDWRRSITREHDTLSLRLAYVGFGKKSAFIFTLILWCVMYPFSGLFKLFYFLQLDRYTLHYFMASLKALAFWISLFFGLFT